MAGAAAAPVAKPPAASAAPERLLTRPLIGFLALVALALAASLASRWQRPDLPATLRCLADGDLDGAERVPMLRRLRQLAPATAGPTAKWAEWLAAIALEVPGTGSVPPAEPPTAADRPFLGLGDPVLDAACAAGLAESAGDRPAALAQWQLVLVRSRLSRRAFAADLAAAAVQRLGG